MKSLWKLTTIAATLAGACLMFVNASEPRSEQSESSPGNSYYLYTNRLAVQDTGVVEIPADYRWSVETSWRGLDLHGRDLPDTRVMLRLFNPEVEFSALTAQMDLATAAKLHHDLGQVIIKKLQDPSYQDRSHVGRSTTRHQP